MAQSVTVDRTDSWNADNLHTLPVHVGGRVLTSALPPPAPPRARRFTHEWPGVYFEAAFRGRAVILRFDDPANEYRLFVDGLAPITIAQPGTALVTISDLSSGTHHIRVEKITESIGIIAHFDGFYVRDHDRARHPRRRSRQIGFIGDSWMTGYGIRSTSRQCSREQVRLLTDTQSAYPALTARHLDADYHIMAYSGRGMVRNYGGLEPTTPMGALHERSLPSVADPWRDDRWQPQIIVIGLYANDYATPLRAGEPWRDDATRDAAFVAGYGRLLQSLHARSAQAMFVIIWPEQRNAARLAMARSAGIRRIVFAPWPVAALADDACDYHANMSDHRLLANWLYDFIAAQPDIWRRR